MKGKTFPAKHFRTKHTTGLSFGVHRLMGRFLVFTYATNVVDGLRVRKPLSRIALLLVTDNASSTDDLLINNSTVQS
jgi:hypothetical protein